MQYDDASGARENFFALAKQIKRAEETLLISETQGLTQYKKSLFMTPKEYEVYHAILSGRYSGQDTEVSLQVTEIPNDVNLGATGSETPYPPSLGQVQSAESAELEQLRRENQHLFDKLHMVETALSSQVEKQLRIQQLQQKQIEVLLKQQQHQQQQQQIQKEAQEETKPDLSQDEELPEYSQKGPSTTGRLKPSRPQISEQLKTSDVSLTKRQKQEQERYIEVMEAAIQRMKNDNLMLKEENQRLKKALSKRDASILQLKRKLNASSDKRISTNPLSSTTNNLTQHHRSK